jgi:hypothetical protein
MRKELNSKTQAKYKRSGYKDFTPHEKEIFERTNTPDEYITLIRKDENSLNEIAVLHYVGGPGVNPWLNSMPQQNLWQYYYNLSVN